MSTLRVGKLKETELKKNPLGSACICSCEMIIHRVGVNERKGENSRVFFSLFNFNCYSLMKALSLHLAFYSNI